MSYVLRVSQVGLYLSVKSIIAEFSLSDRLLLLQVLKEEWNCGSLI